MVRLVEKIQKLVILCNIFFDGLASVEISLFGSFNHFKNYTLICIPGRVAGEMLVDYEFF